MGAEVLIYWGVIKSKELGTSFFLNNLRLPDRHVRLSSILVLSQIVYPGEQIVPQLTRFEREFPLDATPQLTDTLSVIASPSAVNLLLHIGLYNAGPEDRYVIRALRKIGIPKSHQALKTLKSSYQNKLKLLEGLE